MIGSKLILLAAIASLLQIANLGATDIEQQPNYENPIRNEVDDEVTNLPGLKTPINFRQFSGYLPADDETAPKKFLHYWFVESQSGKPQSDPLVLWLNGGPGCSSLLGFLTELGPFRVNNDAKTLSLNPHSWNKKANVIFLESPSGVGFSYSRSLVNLHTDDTTAKQNYLALKAFMRKFPQYKNNSLYLTGESYAGVYLPTLGQLIDADPSFNLRGIAIGNGYLDATKLKESLVFFAYHHGLIGKSTWDSISRYCCNQQEPTRDNCKFSGPKSSWSCQLALLQVNEAIQSGINPYNIYSTCASRTENQSLANGSPSHLTNRETIDRALLNLAFDEEKLELSRDRLVHVFDLTSSSSSDVDQNLGVEPPCTDEHIVTSYLNDLEVRKALHIPKEIGSWSGCSLLAYVMKYPTRSGGLTPQIMSLVQSKRKLRMLVYNGDVDAVCNFLGDEWFVDDLELELVHDYEIWKVGGQVAGFYKTHKGLTYATVRGSGHMVPADRAPEALMMFHSFINSTDTTAKDLPKYETL